MGVDCPEIGHLIEVPNMFDTCTYCETPPPLPLGGALKYKIEVPV